ncbi:MAG TPA: BlaI/MecI/CopY family transcriptional regulator [Terriglobales bacterium]|jgi:BlaI family penicillinase repressor|nr:BlaI/MecI/CopY family transcriptional regulator [Terriglobales bacterium]
MAKSGRQAPVPTRGELRLLKILWRLGEGTIEDVLQASHENPLPNYKTVQTLLRIMENKKMVTHRLLGRAFVYRPRVQQDEVNRLSIRSLLQRHFEGSRSELLLNLLDDEHIEAAELDELGELIRRRRAMKSPRQG